MSQPAYALIVVDGGPTIRRPFVRTRNGIDGWPIQTGRVFGPRDGPSSDQEVIRCFACGEAFVEGDYTVLIPLGPGADEDARAHARDGQFYSAIAVEAHEECVTGDGRSG